MDVNLRVHHRLHLFLHDKRKAAKGDIAGSAVQKLCMEKSVTETANLVLRPRTTPATEPTTITATASQSSHLRATRSSSRHMKDTKIWTPWLKAMKITIKASSCQKALTPCGRDGDSLTGIWDSRSRREIGMRKRENMPKGRRWHSMRRSLLLSTLHHSWGILRGIDLRVCSAASARIKHSNEYIGYDTKDGAQGHAIQVKLLQSSASRYEKRSQNHDKYSKTKDPLRRATAS